MSFASRKFVRLHDDGENIVASTLMHRFPYRFSGGTGYFNEATIKESTAFLSEIQEWCYTEFGDDTHRWRQFGVTFNFRDAQDAAVFRIRWG
ncbi:MAG: hypothetical protein EOP83_32950 [Verrucomicrobiaceae bacterium]|nr:MAG: hypothetical protein EOP83_32950 [Verrucomicrobiaceae bacterium]